MTPEQIADKHCVDNTYGEYTFLPDQLAAAFNEYASQFGYSKQDVGDGWDAAIDNLNWSASPNKEQYLASLKPVDDGNLPTVDQYNEWFQNQPFYGRLVTVEQIVKFLQTPLFKEYAFQFGWRDISTAPKDGTKIVVGHPDYDSFPVASWQWVRGEDTEGNDGEFLMLVSEDEGVWEDGTLWPDLGYIEPTVWMPLPSLPNPPIK